MRLRVNSYAAASIGVPACVCAGVGAAAAAGLVPAEAAIPPVIFVAAALYACWPTWASAPLPPSVLSERAMVRKPTIIGSATPTVTPTRIGGTSAVPTRDETPLPTSVAVTKVAPTTIRSAPTPSSPLGTVRTVTAIKPQASPVSTPSSTVSPAAHSSRTSAPPRPTGLSQVLAPSAVTALPGARRVPLTASIDELRECFPQCPPDVLALVQKKLANAPHASDTAMQWLRFGERQQETLSALIKKRLELTSSSGTRLTPAFLSQLKAILRELYESLEGSLFRRSTSKVWSDKRAEVEMLEQRLTTELPNLYRMNASLEELAEHLRKIEQHLQALLFAGEYIEKKSPGSVAAAIAPRLASITASHALAVEQLMLFELECNQLHSLAVLVQDGVLVRLPSVYSLLAQASGRMNETQKLLLAESLSDLMTLIDRKP